MSRKYGWVPDRPDHRDAIYMAPRFERALPAVQDLTFGFPEVYDQRDLGSCTANAIAAAIQFDQIRQKLKSYTPSRLFVYYNERVLEDSVDSDAGAMIRDGIKTINRQGFCAEDEWPYAVEQFAVKPDIHCYKNATHHKALSYQRLLPTLGQIKACICSGLPFVFGISIFASFESDEVSTTGVVPMPKRHESNVGGHAICAAGYDDNKALIKFRNSWGPEWGDKGYGYLPYDYVVNPGLADDFWQISLVS